MSLWFRLLLTVIGAGLRSRMAMVETSVLRFRVMPTDLDFNMHMTNARYHAFMDLGRLDLIIRTGLWRLLLRRHWQPVLGGAVVRFRRPLKPFQRFELRSRMLCWDDKWLYIEHRVEVDGSVACQGVVRGAFVGADGLVAPDEVARACGYRGDAPETPAWIASWCELEAA